MRKTSEAFWRGSTTGGFFTGKNWNLFGRGKLVDLSLQHPTEIDARFTNVVQCTPDVHGLMKAAGMLSKRVDKVDHLKYKYLVDPIVADADKWDKAVFFFTDEEAVNIGRRAQDVAKTIATEYGAPFVASASLATGPVEQLQQSAVQVQKGVVNAAEGVTSFAKYLPWIVAGGAVLLGYGVYKVASGRTGQSFAKGGLRLL
jgi:hypothetical protein